MDVVERLSDEEAHAPTLIGISHVHRYQFAAGLASGKRVLDLCCGTGYGVQLLAETAAAVHGVDVDAPSIESASRKYGGRPGVSFECADALEVLGRRLADDFDLIVIFEGLEHLPDLDRVLALLDGQRESGIGLIASLPNSAAFEAENPFHVTEFDFEGAVEALGRIGAETILYQYLAEGSLIRPRDDAPLSGSSQLSERGEPEHCNNLIALAGVGDAPAADARMHLNVAPASNTYMLDLERTNRQLWRVNRRMARERLGVADSAAAAALEQLRRAEEAPREPPLQSAPVRLWLAVKRAIALILPHGLIVRQQRNKRESEDPRESLR
jgi:SAM-dependent methyltransferase